MLTGKTVPTLVHTLAVHTALISTVISLLLLGGFSTKYMLDTPNLRRATLEAEQHAIIAALRHGDDPAQISHYRQYPSAYGFRVFDRRLASTRRLIAVANPELFPVMRPSASDPAPAAEPEITEGFGQVPDLEGRAGEGRWVFTEHEDVGQRSYWAQIVMVGDPAWRWRTVIADEMLDHVVVPVLSVVPPLALAILLTTHFALRPLKRIARQAAALGTAVSSGGRLAPLATDPLPLEFQQVVSAINAMLARLEHILSLQRQFTSDAAHELRTPLAVLLLQIDDLPPSPVVNNIRVELLGLNTLVNQLLQFAQAEDAAAGERAPVDVGAVARKVCEELAPTALTHRQVIEFDAPDHLMPVFGHAALIETAIRNVVDNAMRHSPANETVLVSVDPSSEVTVEDRGPGVRDEHKELVFNRFWRADRRRSDGTGIGLALVRRIVQLHGGEARVEDRAGGGARFVLNFASPGHG